MSGRQILRWSVLPDADAVCAQTVAVILSCAERAIAERGVFHIVLAGGTTPRAVYSTLRNARQEWGRWQVWFGDERCLPVEHHERNSRMARDVWLDHVAIPGNQLHDIPAEIGPENAALVYMETLAGLAEFDLVLLGIGEDGHTASLFPGHPWGEEGAAPAVLAVTDAPKPPPERVSMSARRLAATRRLMILVTGVGKREAVFRWRAGEKLPVAGICPACGVDVLIEQAACAG